MIAAAEYLPKFAINPLKHVGTGATNVLPPQDLMQFEPASEYARQRFLKQDNLPTGQSNRLLPGGTKAPSDVLAGFAAIGTICLFHFQLPDTAQQAFVPRVEVGTPNTYQSNIVSPAAKLIDEAQVVSGLTLDLIAPLLGVSRRSIQYWKDGEKISVKNELQLRNLVDTLKQISIGNATETRNLLLTRVAGVPRIYDLLAERRYDAAILRARNPSDNKPILSDPTVKFNHRPIEDQLAMADDGPATLKGKLNRSMSRRIVR